MPSAAVTTTLAMVDEDVVLSVTVPVPATVADASSVVAAIVAVVADSATATVYAVTAELKPLTGCAH